MKKARIRVHTEGSVQDKSWFSRMDAIADFEKKQLGFYPILLVP